MTADELDESYSADLIGMGQPLRKPFRHDGGLWICTSITGSGLTESGSTEHEAYRIVPVAMFEGVPTTYNERTGTAEAADAARNDPNGFYHGMAVKHGRDTFVLTGPAMRFVAQEADDRQLALF